MKVRNLVYLFCALCVPAIFAGPAPPEIPVWLRSGVNPNPGSIEVFEAFHTPAGPSKITHIPSQITQSVPAPMRNVAAIFPAEFRSMDGEGNNLINTLFGAAEIPLLRLTTVGYGDGSGTPAGADRLSAREISNLVDAQASLINNTQRISSFVWQWGQFID